MIGARNIMIVALIALLASLCAASAFFEGLRWFTQQAHLFDRLLHELGTLVKVLARCERWQPTSQRGRTTSFRHSSHKDASMDACADADGSGSEPRMTNETPARETGAQSSQNNGSSWSSHTGSNLHGRSYKDHRDEGDGDPHRKHCHLLHDGPEGPISFRCHYAAREPERYPDCIHRTYKTIYVLQRVGTSSRRPNMSDEAKSRLLTKMHSTLRMPT